MALKPLEEIQIAVLCGGSGSEREVSLESGACVTEGLREAGLQARKHILKGLAEEIDTLEADAAFLVLHGEWGEDGTAQRLLENRRIPYCGSGPAASALAMDKYETKLEFLDAGLPTPPAAVIAEASEAAECIAEAGLAYPFVVKPNGRGSSVGVSIVRQASDLPTAVEKALAIDDVALAESFVSGRELTVGFLDGVALPIVELRTGNAFYDYEAKYNSDETEYLCPAPLEDVQTQMLQALALKAAVRIGVRDMARIDLLLADDGPQLLEINTLPGMTTHSLLPKAAATAGVSFPALCRQIMELTWGRASESGV